MKFNKTKTASLIMSCFFLFLVVSCESKKEEPKTEPTPAAAPATPAPTPADTSSKGKKMDTMGTKGKPVVTGDQAPPPAAN